ncbi:MAG: HTTM domain-containing protein, partial [Bacteroidota bacterium]|nr:HTTM domain-containing protein [Bacteroidota bacterium]
MHYILLYLRKVFTVDVRALALMRIGVGFVLLVDLGIRATDLEAHYANMGILPLYVLFQNAWDPYFISIHTISGLWQVQAVLFLIAAIFAFLLLIGYRTRLVTIVSWFFLLSVQNRNLLIGQAGDDLLRMILFWAMFLPWGRFYSLDAKRANDPNRSHLHFSPASAAYVVQIMLVYVCTALLKNSPEWHTTGQALYYALSLDQVLLPGGKLLYPHPDLLQFLTLSTYYIELYLPLALLIPVYTSFFRLLVVGVLTGFHLGISVTLFVGLFYLINWVSFLGLLPPPALNWFEAKLLTHFQ